MFAIAMSQGNIENASVMLKKVQQNGTQAIIASSRLEDFFEQCLKIDNFDGLAYLADYVEGNNVDTTAWDLNRFRSALNFYLNHSFNLNKIMTFTRFYVHQAKLALAKEQLDRDLSPA